MQIKDYIYQQEQNQNLILRRSNRLSLNELKVDETIFSLANGSIGTRQHFIEGYGDNDLPYTFMNGFYDTYTYKYEENSKTFPQIGQNMINLPDASLMTIEANGERLNLTHATLASLERTLDISSGVSSRTALYITPKGYQFEIKEDKIVSHIDTEVIVSKVSIQSLNFTGKLKFKSFLRLPLLKNVDRMDPRLGHSLKQLNIESLIAHEKYGLLKAKTIYSGLEMLSVIFHDLEFTYEVSNEQIIGTLETNFHAGKPFEVTKYQLYTKVDDEQIALSVLLEKVFHKKTFNTYANLEKKYYQSFYEKSYINISDPTLNLCMNYNMFQLNQSGGEKKGQHIAAKGLSGFGYEGHYFWDTEIYMLPFFIFTNPEKARNILMYRYEHLNKARHEAKNLGVSKGAKIPWRTINGYETSPYYPAGSAQVHINSDLSYAIMQYYHQSNDLEFMIEYGFEMMYETALFLLEYGHFKDGHFHIDCVTGPDEYTALVNDNYYTNTMAQKHFYDVYNFGSKHIEALKEVFKKLEIKSGDLDLFHKAAQKMTILIDHASHIAKQDQSFMQKKMIDLSKIPKEKFPLLLNYHPLFIYKHQVLKQADALLSMILLHEKNQRLVKNSFDYYLPLTTHDSSLSKCMYGLLSYRLGDYDLGHTYFKEMLHLDLDDLKKHTQHGLHVANIGGTYLMMIYGILGVYLDHDGLHIEPIRQKHIQTIETHIHFRGKSVLVKVSENALTLLTDYEVELYVYDEKVTVFKAYHTSVK